MNNIENLRDSALKTALKGRGVAVMGLGKSGVSAAKALLRHGAKVFISESEKEKKDLSGMKAQIEKISAAHSGDVRFEFGGHTQKILQCDLIVVSPGIHLDLPLFAKARKKGIPVWNELELGYRLAKFKKIAAITGTNGKTTAVSLLGDMCRRSGARTLVAGNIGNPLCDFSETFAKYDIAVLEVSSYQMEGISSFRPDVSAVLNLTSDHLARHKTMKNYSKAKERIFINQSGEDFTALNASDPWTVRMGKNAVSNILWFSAFKRLKTGVFFDSGKGVLAARVKNLRYKKLNLPSPRYLPGMHNIENACCAAACALALGIKPAAIKESLLAFKGVEHRIEKVRTLRGVTYVNDSKGTNVDSTLKAIQSFEKPLWLILGGQDKGGSYKPIKDAIRDPGKKQRIVKGIFLIGEASRIIYSALQGSCDMFFCGKLESAVKEASRKAADGDVVLLSPACASFDQFLNFEDRGLQFKRFVRVLK